MAETTTIQTPLIYKKIIEVMADVNAISKGRLNKDQHFTFRGIDDVMNELHSSLAKCGVFVLPKVLEETRTEGKTKSGGTMYYTRLKINFGFYAEDGSHVDAVVIGEAMDTADKASNKALSIGLKYAMLQVFCIPTEDDKDPDAESPQPAAGSMKTEQPKKQPAKLDFEPKGGATTDAEKNELNNLFKATYADGIKVFSKADAKKYSDMRKDYTAREVIDTVKKDLQARLNPTQTMQKASDLQQQAAAQKAAETVKETFSGEFVEQPSFDNMQNVDEPPYNGDVF